MSTTPTEPTTALAVIETLTSVELFQRLNAKSEQALTAAVMYSPGVLDVILSRIEEEARKQADGLEISTEANRKALASVAYKVARSKSYVDDQGKALGEHLREQLNAINGDRNKAKTRLEALQDEIRKPLTDWEQADKNRCDAHEKALKEIEEAGEESLARWSVLSAEAMLERLKEIETDPRQWEEFSQRAAGVKAVAKVQILQAVDKRQKYDAEQAELKRLREEEQERIAKAREEAAARAATEAAEKKAQEAAEAAQRAAQAEQERLRQEAEYAERKRVAAEQEAKRQLEAAEARRVAEEQAAKRREEEAAARAKREQEAAVERERQRVAAAAEAERIAAEKREASKRHRAKIQREAKVGLIAAGLSAKDAEAALAYIVSGQVPHVSIEY